MRPLVALSLAAFTASALAFVACAGSEATTPSSDDGGSAPDGEGTPAEGDSAAPPSDAGADAKTAKDANGPGEAGADCSFNRDCQAALRCECDEVNGCACKPGPRGTGQNAVDHCDSGNDCASAVCVEGPPDSGYYCTDECATAADCIVPLPQCSDIAFVGRICVRATPK